MTSKKTRAKKVPVQMNVLETANSLIYGDRQKAYGSAAKNFTDIGVGWANILGVPVSAEQVGIMMIWLKCCRQLNKASRDNLVDICGYAGCIEKVQNGE